MSTDQPQLQFDDLYTVVYALIDDAKTGAGPHRRTRTDAQSPF